MNIKNVRLDQFRPYALPVALLLGSLFHGFCARLQFLTPYLIFLILFMTLCDMDVRDVRIRPLHLWLILFQTGTAMGLYFILRPVNQVIAQGTMMGILAPVAVSSTVIAVILGAKMSNMIAYTILNNIVLALTAPLIFTFAGDTAGMPFLASAWLIIKRVAPIIVFPLIAALICQRFFPKIGKGIVRFRNVPFYLWAFALTLVFGQTIEFIIHQDRSGIPAILIMTLISLLECIMLFAVGRWIGKKYGDSIGGGQALGQKNTLLAVWMTQIYLYPMASIVPATYVLWQNIWNSWQLWRVRAAGKVHPEQPQDATK
ncbi:MAG: transporter [Bacteroidales bacterium]|jgi:BASS family bile acid:Na+ symporter